MCCATSPRTRPRRWTHRDLGAANATAPRLDRFGLRAADGSEADRGDLLVSSDLEARCAALVVELDLGRAGDIDAVEQLTGGVASDIARVRIGGRDICAKFALPKLKVAEDWQAPVHRNAAEYAWLEVAAEQCPDSAITLYGRSERLHGFAMEFLGGDAVYLWKAALLNEAPDRGEARAVGAMLGRIHAASAAPGFDGFAFRNRDDFRALRIEPYLTFTAMRHPDLPALPDLAEQLYQSERVLVHGDVSPKNILFRGAAPVLLDAECATMGDAAFDPAFCINHLILKAAHLPGSRARLLDTVAGFWAAYGASVTWEDRKGLERRISRLIPALMLARVDGKSPVEYLTEARRADIRRMARALLRAPVADLRALTDRLRQEMKDPTP